MPELAPDQTLDQYRLLDVIARSGMATIFRAEDLDSGETVVLKIPHMQFEGDLVFHERFRREEEIGQRLSHPAVIRVLRPREKSRLYMAMEYAPGELLRDVIARQTRLPIERAVALAIQIADALDYIHGQGVVHRDLKPENVMVMPDGKVKLIDFGIAHDATLRKITWSGLSQTMGTPDYMAPEQVRGKPGDERTDLYSLGAILYEMLTGKVPFPSDGVYDAMRAKVEEDPVPPRKLRPEIPPAVDQVVQELLGRDPHRRPESALEVREKLAHPGSVVLGVGAPHRRTALPMPTGPWRILVPLGALVGWVLLLWALAHVGSGGTDPARPEASGRHLPYTVAPAPGAPAEK